MIEKTYFDKAVEAAEKGDWEQAITLARRTPVSWDVWQQFPGIARSHGKGIPNEALHQILDTMQRSSHRENIDSFLFEYSNDIPEHADAKTLNRIAELGKSSGYVTEAVHEHPNWIPDDKTRGLQDAVEFWNSYERKVKAHHFATIHSLNTGEPHTITDHRGGIGSSHEHMQVLPHLKELALLHQREILKDAQEFPSTKEFEEEREHVMQTSPFSALPPRFQMKYFQGEPHIKVFRGINGKYAKTILDKAQFDPDTGTVAKKVLHVPTSAFHSWSIDAHRAKSFATGRPDLIDNIDCPVVLEKWVPLRHVLYTGFHTVVTGQQHPHRGEFEICVNHPEGKIKIPTKNLHIAIKYGKDDSGYSVLKPVNVREPAPQAPKQGHGNEPGKQGYLPPDSIQQAEASKTLKKTEYNSPEFKGWFDGSRAVDPEGKPLMLYRGVRRPSLKGRIHTESYTDSPDVASIYSASPATYEFGEGASVFPVHLSIKNPVHLPEAQHTFGDVLKVLKYGQPNGITQDEAIKMLNHLVNRESDQNLPFWVSRTKTGLPGFKYTVHDDEGNELDDGDLPFSLTMSQSWLREFRDDFKYMHDNEVLENAHRLKADTYAFVDTPRFKAVAERLGHDGVIHQDIFDTVHDTAPKILDKKPSEVKGLNENYGAKDYNYSHVTYRPFKPEQVKSIFNKGTFNPNDSDIGKSEDFDEEESDVETHVRLGRVGVHPDDIKFGDKVPNVNFHTRDLQDTGPVNETSVIKDYGSGAPAVAYKAYIPTHEMPDYKLAEEEDARSHKHSEDECGEQGESCPYQDGGMYDWDQFRYRSKNAFPPAKVLRDAEGKLHLLDGNHRTKYWTDLNHTHIPAWIIDEQFDVKKTELKKGVMQRLAPKFDPQKTDSSGRWNIKQWQSYIDGGLSNVYRQDIPHMEGAARIRALHKLAAKTPVRLNAQGQREFLLHRGSSTLETYHAKRNGVINHPDGASSWSPNFWAANNFQQEYKGQILSAWVPEHKIKSIPKQLGAPLERGKNMYQDEYEVIVHPDHNSKEASEDELSNAISTPKALAERGNIDQKITNRAALGKKPSLKKSEGSNLLEGSSHVIEAMLGFYPHLRSSFDAAKFLVSGKDLHLNDIRRALWEQDGDTDKAALFAYGLDPEEKNLKALNAVRKMSSVKKSEYEDVNAKVEALVPEAEQAAEQIQLAFKSHFVFPVELGGIHSKGSLLARNESTGDMWLLKPAAGGPSPAAGSQEQIATQPRREAAFWHVANKWGLGADIPQTDLVAVNGKEFAALKLLPWSYTTLKEKQDKDPNQPRKVFHNPLRGTLVHQWAALDYILGNPDRHAANMMVNDEGKIALIDHGSAFAGESFSPGYDRSSFVPFYLRAWAPKEFNRMSAKEKLRALPRIGDKAAKQLREWAEGLNEDTLHYVLHTYGVEAKSAMFRLGRLKIALKQEPADLAINRLWVET
jgi:hypothetical protein